MTATPTPDGLVLVDKPAGVSSHDVVLAVRRAIGERRIGHAGTLDPFATGLLVMLVGRATRLLPHMPGDPKVYDATITFGSETDTEDLHGAVTRTAPLPTRAAVLGAIPALTGLVSQVPPAYSAKRIGGRRAYDMARKGIDTPLTPVDVRVDAWTLLEWSGSEESVSECRVRITCGPGTYVRSLARDLARSIASAAHLRALRRVSSGAFNVADGCSLEQLRDRAVSVRPALDALPHLNREVLDDAAIASIVRGIDVAATVPGAWGALVGADSGVLVALAERRDDRWQPRVVMRPMAEAHTP